MDYIKSIGDEDEHESSITPLICRKIVGFVERLIRDANTPEIYIRNAQTYLSVCPERSQYTEQRQCIG